MSNEGFLKRWSRRKRVPEPERERTSAETPPSNLPPQTGEGPDSPPIAGEGRAGANPPKPEDEAVDPATLPPIENLGPDSDYTVFLKKGVPEALRVAALRKAWMSDPFIRDFRGPAEYALDYTTSEFDLRPTDDVAKMLDRIFPPKTPEVEGEKPAQAKPAAQALTPPEPPKSVAPPDLRLPQKETGMAAPPAPNEPARAEPAPPRRKHGGALPD